MSVDVLSLHKRLLCAIPFLLLILAPQGQADDDFSGRFLDADIWADQDIIKRIRGGRLLTGFRQTNRTQSSRIYVIDPLSTNEVEAKITVLNADASGTSPRAYIAGLFFSDGPAGAGVENAVFAEVNMTYTGVDLDVQFQVGRCNDPQCLSFTNFFFDTTTVPNVAIGTTHRLGLRWDGAFRFDFRFDGHRLSYDTSSDVAAIFPPGPAFRQIGTRVFNPTGSGFAAIRATIDNVRINGMPYDRFSTSQLDATKWRGDNLEITRKINRRKQLLVTRMRRSELDGNNHLNLRDTSSVSFMAADVLVDASSTTAAGLNAARNRARLTGYWYNDGSPVDGDTGEIQAEIRIIDRNRGGPLDIEYFIARCIDPACSTSSTCAFNGAFGETVVGQWHRLSIEWDLPAQAFNFGWDGVVETVPIAGLGCNYAEPSRTPFKGIGTRIDSLGPGEEASITALFDNVQLQ